MSVARGPRNVVHDVTIEVPPGEVTTLLGPNGAGKSSLALACAGLARVTKGWINLDGNEPGQRSPGEDPRRRNVGRPGGPAAAAHLTVEENLMVATYSLGQAGCHRWAWRTRCRCFPSWRSAGQSRADRCRAASSRWSCWPRLWCLGQRCWSSTSCRSASRRSSSSDWCRRWRRSPASGVGVLLIEQFAHVALSLGQGGVRARRRQGALQRFGRRAHRSDRSCCTPHTCCAARRRRAVKVGRPDHGFATGEPDGRYVLGL